MLPLSISRAARVAGSLAVALTLIGLGLGPSQPPPTSRPDGVPTRRRPRRPGRFEVRGHRRRPAGSARSTSARSPAARSTAATSGPAHTEEWLAATAPTAASPPAASPSTAPAGSTSPAARTALGTGAPTCGSTPPTAAARRAAGPAWPTRSSTTSRSGPTARRTSPTPTRRRSSAWPRTRGAVADRIWADATGTIASPAGLQPRRHRGLPGPPGARRGPGQRRSAVAVRPAHRRATPVDTGRRRPGQRRRPGPARRPGCG